ncbi:MAG: PAS domain S-box protein, partial [Candidatus Binatia bacterium]
DQVLLGFSDNNCISCSGPLLVLDAQEALHLALMLHELATNARKYGALSVPNGHLSITWEVRTNGGQNLLLLWKESGGPKVSVPSAPGFGSTLIERTLRATGGEASVHYNTNGVSCEIKLPLAEKPRPSIGTDAAVSKIMTGLLAHQPQDNQRSLKGKRILIIEDEPLVSMDIESTLMMAGCEVIGPAGTLENAKLLVEDANYDAALVDANLAGYPVDELATVLTQKNRPFAFVTGYGRDALPRGFREAVVLGKPFGQDQLLAVVEVLLFQANGVLRLRNKKV